MTDFDTGVMDIGSGTARLCAMLKASTGPRLSVVVAAESEPRTTAPHRKVRSPEGSSVGTDDPTSAAATPTRLPWSSAMESE
jgi:hypothetical protein